MGLISPQYHKGHTEKPRPRPSGAKRDAGAPTTSGSVSSSPSKSPKRPGPDNSADVSASKRTKISDSDQVLSPLMDNFLVLIPFTTIQPRMTEFAKPATPNRSPSARPRSPTKSPRAKHPSSQSGNPSLPPIRRKKDIPPSQKKDSSASR